ncbi:MAG: deoxyribose-phosphate aldolase [bacterium]|nr:MAG: deoxyribose-phosphate aldolase [Fervidicoccus sp.]
MAYPPLEELGKMIDYAVLRPDTNEETIIRACEEAKKWHFAALCVHPCWIPLVRTNLQGSDVKLCSVVAFPLGTSTKSIKVAEARNAISLGADELDIVANLGLFKSGKQEEFLNEITALVETCRMHSLTLRKGNVLTKIIIECGYLSKEEIRQISLLLLETGADFIKTSTGFGPRGTSLDDVRTIRNVVGGAMRIKAAGGIKSLNDVISFLGAGADRIGTSSAVQIMEEYRRMIGS